MLAITGEENQLLRRIRLACQRTYLPQLRAMASQCASWELRCAALMVDYPSSEREWIEPASDSLTEWLMNKGVPGADCLDAISKWPTSSRLLILDSVLNSFTGSAQDADLMVVHESIAQVESLLQAERLRGEAFRRIEEERLQVERLKEEREREISALAHQWFESDFLSADDRFRAAEFTEDFREAYSTAKVRFVINWMAARHQAGLIDQLPDDHQAKAIAAVGGDVLVTARAGSGKTAITVLRAYFLIEHCRVDPRSILMLAFNRAAVLEVRKRLLALLAPSRMSEYGKKMSERRRTAGGRLSILEVERIVLDEIEEEFGVEMPFVATFHSISHALSTSAGNILYDNVDVQNFFLTDRINAIVREMLDSVERGPKVRSLLLRHFKEDWEKVASELYQLQGEDLLVWLRSLQHVTLGGEYVKSAGEKRIADWLFEHGIPYRYEMPRSMGKYTAKPDFTIENPTGPNVIIEYYGLEHSSNKYDRNIAANAEYWSTQSDHRLVELRKNEVHDAAALDRKLLREFEQVGIPVRTLRDEEIWDLLKDRARLRFADAVSRFLTRARQLGLSPGNLRERASSDQFGFSSQVEEDFVRLATDILEEYQGHLGTDTDFPQMFEDAAAKIRAGSNVFSRNNRV